MAFGILSQELVEKAVKGRTAETRALAAQAIGRIVRDKTLTDAERRLTNQIFDILSRDVAEEVRRALAITLRLSSNLSNQLANRLIRDVDTIAIPILASSPAIDDEDLVAILDSKAAAKVQAIATRKGLSEKVSRAVLKTCDRHAVIALAANDTALISAEDASHLVELSRTDDLIREAALRRRDMPHDLAVKLIDLQIADVDTALSGETEYHSDLSQQTRTRTMSRWSKDDWSPSALSAYIFSLNRMNRLSEAVVARAAGQGDWRFVQIALGCIAGVAPGKAAMMVLDGRPFGLKALLRRTQLGEAAREILIVSAEAYRDLEQTGEALSRERFQRRMEERIATHPSADWYGDIWADWLDSGLGPKEIATA